VDGQAGGLPRIDAADQIGDVAETVAPEERGRDRAPLPSRAACPANASRVLDRAARHFSGLGMSGQVVTVDKGGVFADNIMRLYAERESLGL
jgi:hypothetical protein